MPGAPELAARRFTRFICVGAGASLIIVSSFSLAQDDQADSTLEEAERVVEEIIVTGTRIKRRDFSSPSPLTSIDREAFEFSGQPTLEEYLNRMPQIQPDYGRTSNNPGDGTARLNLRGLGAGRTLVLLNGRRVAPSGVGSAVDVNNLPRSLIERVEIITGGASTVYGSDAVAGVINFITRQEFDGIGFDTSYSVTAEGDSDIFDMNAVFGHDLANGRGNITVYAGYYDRDQMLASERAFTAVNYSENWETGELDERGSGTIPAGSVLFPQVDLGGGPVRLTWNPDGSPRAFDPANDLYNFAPVNYLQTPLTRSTAGLMATLDVSERFEAYVEASFARNEARRTLAPQPAFDLFVVNTDNPVLSPETRQVFEEQMLPVAPGLVGMLLARRMSELGPRIFDSTREYTRLVTGLRGEFAEGWDVDAWITYTDSNEATQLLNRVDVARLAQGLLVDPGSGECFDPSDGCVPLDIFGEDRLSPEGVDFIRARPLDAIAERTQTLASVVVTGSPFDIWSGPLDMAFGAEWRRDKGRFRDDDALRNEGPAGVDGTETVLEFYAEALVPLLDSESQYLGLELGARWSDYKNAGSVWTYKAGAEWQPVDFMRFRTMYQHAVRAPNLEELFTTQTTGLAPGVLFTSDPCSASMDPVGSGNADKCIAQGIPADQIGVFEETPNYPVYYTTGGNPGLKPESSDTFTAGVIITPSAPSGLTVAIDYFDIEITDTIGGITAINVCFDSLNTDGVFCENIRRDATLNIAEVTELTSNRGLEGTTGVDTQLQYVAELPPSVALFEGDARIGVNAIWTHVFSVEAQENLVTRVYDTAGYFGWPCRQDIIGGTCSSNRVTSNFDYSSGPLDIHLTWRWIEGTRNGGPLYSADFGIPDPKLALPTVSSYSYFDLGFGWHFSDSILARFGVNNLFDKQPPQMADNVWSNGTDTGTYDVFGRTYFLSLSVEM
jgi:outer membrane receptor protein involved in Fe transport